MSPMEFHASVMGYCYATRGSVSSYGRTEKHNADVGGKPTSNHRLWRAADVIYDEPIEKATRIALAARYGLEIVEEIDHDHVEPKP